MIKKLIAIGGASALLLGAAVPVFAWGSRDVAIVSNSATAIADTGLNTQDNYAVANRGHNEAEVEGDGNRNMTTGNATAYAGALVVANTHVGCGCESRGHKDIAIVGNSALADAYTGDNHQDDVAAADRGHNEAEVEGDGNRNMTTGVADSTARAWTIVNTHLSFGD